MRIPYLILFSVLMQVSCGTIRLGAQEIPVAPAEKKSFGRLVTVAAPVDDQVVSQVTSIAVRLQAQARRENRDAVLVLEIRPGSSRFGQVSDLARFLSSAEVSRVRTVAWLPETVDGIQAILALACHEIVMAPNASLGDIGRGATVSDEEQELILSIVDRRRNSRLSRGIARAMMSPAVALLRVTVEPIPGQSEKRYVSAEDLRLLQEQQLVITATETVKEAGAPGRFHASDALRAGFLIAATAQDRRDVVALYDLPLEAMREEGLRDEAQKVVLIEVRDLIDPVLGDFVHRELRKAVRDGASLVIFDIDSPGGFLHVSDELAMAISDLDPRKVTTVAWIRQKAISGAAVVALGCDRIFMHPEAKLGDAGVIQETAAGGAFERAPEKIVAPFLQSMADLARRRNRPVALLQAMVDRDLEVFEVTHRTSGRVTWMSQAEIEDSPEEWVKGALVPESRAGILLTVNGVRAHELGLAELPCNDLGALRLRLGIPEALSLKPAAKTWVDTLVFVLNTQVGGFLLITLAILCIYIELHLPSGFFGILSVILFALFFWSRYLGGTAGTLELLMFLIGGGLLAIELIVLPGFGVFGVTGILLILGSLVMASHTYAGLTAGQSFDRSLGSLGTMAGALFTVVVAAVILNRFLPTIPFLRHLILTPPGYAAAGTEGPVLNPTLATGSVAGPVNPGAPGVAATMLRPSGRAVFGEQYLDVVSEGGFIDPGTPVEVIRVAGNRIVVRPVPTCRSHS